MAVPEQLFVENLRKTQCRLCVMGEIFTHFA